MGFDALRFAVTALALRGDIANLLVATAPTDRTGCADTKAIGSLSTGQTPVNRGYNPSAKINGKRFGHAC
jgi:hypothetical protein